MAGDAPTDVTLCFTDIQSSTELWEAHPQGMYDSLQIHNSLIRKLSSGLSGYECKTIGDSFMLCFADCTNACQFGIETQRQLLLQHWPLEILSHPLCEPQVHDGRPLWGGLRVRIGIHCGAARAQRNPISGRYDYFGPTVNVAARVEASLGKGGLVGTTTAVLDVLGQDGLAALGDPSVTSLGPRVLKGVRDPVQMHLILPRELAPRADVLTNTNTDHASSSCSLDGATRTATGVSITVPGVPSASNPKSPPRSKASSTVELLQTSSVRTSPSISPTNSNTAVGEGRLSPYPRSPRLSALALRLCREKASCATVRTPLTEVLQHESQISAHHAVVDTAAEASHGALAAVLSGGIVITWNAGRPCVEHARACALFIHNLQEDPRALICHCGAASGGVLYGNITAGRKRFATAIGGCVELSTALAEEAELCADSALADATIALVYAETGVSRWAQLWRDGLQPGGFMVWSLQQESGDPFDSLAARLAERSRGSRRSSSAWGDPLVSAFRSAAVLSGEEQMRALHQLQQEHPTETQAVEHLLLRAERGALRKRQVAAMPWICGDV